MMKPKIYVVQFGTGASINLLPLAAGQLYSRLQGDDVIPKQFDLPEIIFRYGMDVIIAVRFHQQVYTFMC